MTAARPLNGSGYPKKVRNLAVSVYEIVPSKQEQLELFSSRTHALSEAMDRITAANEAIPKSITRATHALMREQSRLHLCRGTRVAHSWRPRSAYPPWCTCHFASLTSLLPSCRSSWGSLASRSSTSSQPKHEHSPRQVLRTSSHASETACST